MNKIAYVIPYFGKLPTNFPLWLISCEANPTIDWIIYTDDKSFYNYPQNVKVKYCTFDDIKKKIQENFDFKILIDRPWKLCDYKVAYGEIFKEDLKEYDFWGYCDIDVLWGNIRKFITDDILKKYDKIGFQGHSTLYKNNSEVNSRYKMEFSDLPSYKEIFSTSRGYCFDEDIITKIYDKMDIPYYKKVNFAHLSLKKYSFFLWHLSKENDYKNKRQVFIWNNGNLYRKYLYDKNIYEEEFMYIHFFTRPMTYKVNNANKNKTYVIYPDVVKELKQTLTYQFINKHGKCSKIEFYAKMLWHNRKKITIKKIINRIKIMISS